MSTILDTPSQINMWVLLSRRHQIQMHIKGLKTPGIVKWCRANIEGAENARTASDCIVPVESAIAMAGGETDFSLVNVHVMTNKGDYFKDEGIFNDMSEVEANAGFVANYAAGRLEIVYTLEDVRPANGQMFIPA